MRILNICMGAPFTEGYTYQDNLLSEYQAKHGHEVVVLTTTRKRGANGKITETIPEDKMLTNGVRLIRLKAPSKLLAFLGIFPGVEKSIKAVAPDFIFIHGLASMVPKAAISYQRKHPNIRIVADNHQDKGTTYTDHFPFNLQLWFFRKKWRKWIQSVDKIYSTTSWRKTFAAKYYGIPNDKLDVLIMGIDSDRLPSNTQEVRKKVRDELGIPSNAFLFISGGKLDRNKHTLELMRAFASLKDKNIRLLLFGAVLPDIKDEFESILADDSRMKYIGYIKSQEVHRYFLTADFGLFPGRHSVLWEEAIGCGLPCLFRKYEENDHTEICGNCIRIAKPTVPELQTVLGHILADHVYYANLKAQSLLATKEFSYHAIAEKSIECAKAH